MCEETTGKDIKLKASDFIQISPWLELHARLGHGVVGITMGVLFEVDGQECFGCSLPISCVDVPWHKH